MNKLQNEITLLENKRKRLVDMKIDELVTDDIFKEKYDDLTMSLDKLILKRNNSLQKQEESQKMTKRLEAFTKILKSGDILENFDRTVFENIIEKVIVGGTDSDNNIDPFQLTFVFKTGSQKKEDGYKFQKKKVKSDKNNLSSHTNNEDSSICSHSNNSSG